MKRFEVVTSVAKDFIGWLTLAKEVEKLFGPMVSEKAFHDALKEKISDGLAYVVRQESSKSESSLLGGIVISKKDNEIIWFAVSEKQRGNGLGALLLSHSIDNLDKSKPITVTTFDESVKEVYLRENYI